MSKSGFNNSENKFRYGSSECVIANYWILFYVMMLKWKSQLNGKYLVSYSEVTASNLGLETG